MKKLILILFTTFSGHCLTMEKELSVVQDIFQKSDQTSFNWFGLPAEIKTKILEDYTKLLALSANSGHVFKENLLKLRFSSREIYNLLENMFTKNFILATAQELNKSRPTSFYMLGQILLSKPKFEEFKKYKIKKEIENGEEREFSFEEYADLFGGEILSMFLQATHCQEKGIEIDIQKFREIINRAISEGPNLNINGFLYGCPLRNAIGVDFAIAKSLIEAYADLNLQNMFGLSPLSVAVANGKSEIVKMLIDGKVNLNSQNLKGETALILLMQNTNYLNSNVKNEIAKMLIDAGADVNIRDSNGESVLQWAEREKITCNSTNVK